MTGRPESKQATRTRHLDPKHDRMFNSFNLHGKEGRHGTFYR